MTIARGIAQIVNNNYNTDSIGRGATFFRDFFYYGRWLRFSWDGVLYGIYNPVIIAIVVWLFFNFLLSRTRTAIVTGDIRPLREAASASAAVAYRAEPGVVGRITECADGWCRFDVKGRSGWIQTDHIWGD